MLTVSFIEFCLQFSEWLEILQECWKILHSIQAAVVSGQKPYTHLHLTEIPALHSQVAINFSR